jgi:ketosteroid isomerase-like protein
VSAATNITTVRRYYEECANDDGDPAKTRALAVVDQILSDDFAMRYNNQSDAEAVHGRDQHKAFLLRHTRNFAGERWTIEGIVADEELVACRWRLQATHTETGQPIDLRAADFFTVRDGQLAELRRFLDYRTLMSQLHPPSTEPEAHN